MLPKMEIIYFSGICGAGPIFGVKEGQRTFSRMDEGNLQR